MKKYIELLISITFIFIISELFLIEVFSLNNYDFNDKCIDILSKLYDSGNYTVITIQNSTETLLYIYKGSSSSKPYMIIIICYHDLDHTPNISGFQLVGEYNLYGGGSLYCFIRKED